jgi:DNA-binding transcriptional regulator YhcF (GntR family)
MTKKKAIVIGGYECAERFPRLNEMAKQHNVTLITALGANPGIPGIALMSVKDDFGKLVSCTIEFVLGARLDGVSASSINS